MDALSDTFAALADPTRRAILVRLAHGETHVGDLASPFRISAPAISRHLRVLERAGLIEREARAQRRVCRLRPKALQEAHGWLEKEYRRFWERGLDRLARFVESQDPRPAASRKTPPTKPNRRRKR